VGCLQHHYTPDWTGYIEEPTKVIFVYLDHSCDQYWRSWEICYPNKIFLQLWIEIEVSHFVPSSRLGLAWRRLVGHAHIRVTTAELFASGIYKSRDHHVTQPSHYLGDSDDSVAIVVCIRKVSLNTFQKVSRRGCGLSPPLYPGIGAGYIVHVNNDLTTVIFVYLVRSCDQYWQSWDLQTQNISPFRDWNWSRPLCLSSPTVFGPGLQVTWPSRDGYSPRFEKQPPGWD